MSDKWQSQVYGGDAPAESGYNIVSERAIERVLAVRDDGEFEILRERDRVAVELRFGLLGEPPRTLEAVSLELYERELTDHKLSRERVRQVVDRSLRMMGCRPWD